MTIAQGLKEKNRLVSKIRENLLAIQTHNSIPEQNERKVNTSTLVRKTDNLVNELVDLKTRIHTANQPVYHKIFELSELKNLIADIRNVDTTEGIRTGYRSNSEVTYKAELDSIDMKNIIGEYQNQIDELQDELDEWNHNTII